MSPGGGHRFGVDSGPHDFSGGGAGGLPVGDADHAVDDHAADTGRLAPKTLGLTGQVEYELDLGGADLRWIEDDHVGVPPLGDAAPVGEAETGERVRR